MFKISRRIEVSFLRIASTAVEVGTTRRIGVVQRIATGTTPRIGTTLWGFVCQFSLKPDTRRLRFSRLCTRLTKTLFLRQKASGQKEAESEELVVFSKSSSDFYLDENDGLYKSPFLCNFFCVSFFS
jgi:hypothetical protein